MYSSCELRLSPTYVHAHRETDISTQTCTDRLRLTQIHKHTLNTHASRCRDLQTKTDNTQAGIQTDKKDTR